MSFRPGGRPPRQNSTETILRDLQRRVNALEGNTPPRQERVNVVAATGNVILPDTDIATVHDIKLSTSCTIMLPVPGTGKKVNIVVTQSASGGNEVISWSSPSGAIRFPSARSPGNTLIAGASDIFEFICVDGTNWLGYTVALGLM